MAEQCRRIASRVLAGGPSLTDLKQHAKVFNAHHLAEQIRRLESSIETDPSLAIGTAKELIETCCKTILAERGKPVDGTPDVSTLAKQTMKELRLIPEGIPDSARGSDVIKRLLSNLGTIGNGLAELRGLYGTGHGKHGTNRLERTPRKIDRWCGIHTDSLSFRDTHGNKSKIAILTAGSRLIRTSVCISNPYRRRTW